MRSVVSAIRFLLGVIWTVDRRSLLLAGLETLTGILSGARPLGYGMVVGGTVTAEPLAVAGGLALLVITSHAALALNLLGTDGRLRLMEAMRHHFDTRIAGLSGRLATMDHLCDPRVLDRIGLIVSQRGALGSACNSLLNATRALGHPLMLIGVAVTADLRMGLVALAAVPVALVAAPQVRWTQAAEETGAPGGRQAEHLVRAAGDRSNGSELRIFAGRRFLLDRLDRAVIAWRAPYRAAALRSALLTGGVSVGYFLVAGAVLVWLIADAAGGAVAVGAVTVALTSVVGLRDSFGSAQFGIDQVAGLTRTVTRYRWLEQYAAGVDVNHTGTRVPPERLDDGIRLRGVSFSYPGSEVEVLHHVDLHLPAGATVAVVGENGSAKTTLMALLLGLFDADSGSITVDGVALGDLDLAAWRRRCAGIMQDHLRPELRIDEAVGIGGLVGDDLADDPGHVRVAAAVERAHATEVVDRLADGWDTQLGRPWPGGVELSGGQWQRLALARGMMRTDPLLTVLDEPTSALDPMAEDRLLSRYVATAEQARATGGISVIITHRLSTISAADLVVVLHQGSVAEVGTHAELLASGGRYAELYRLQARGYLAGAS